jgi:hypothetical protein
MTLGGPTNVTLPAGSGTGASLVEANAPITAPINVGLSHVLSGGSTAADSMTLGGPTNVTLPAGTGTGTSLIEANVPITAPINLGLSHVLSS